MSSPVIVVDHDPAWAADFEQLREVIAATLGDLALAIEHVGSTSVAGLAAKPVIDIDVVIADRAELPRVIERLASIGYAHRGDLGVAGRESFRGGPRVEPARAWPRHHLYVCARDARELRRHLALRDWLRTHADDREAYATLKRRLALEFPGDIDGYCDAKRGLIETLLVRATGEGLVTARTVMRPFTLDDLPYAHPVFADPEAMRFAAGSADHEPAATARRLERYIALQAERGVSKWAIWSRESGAYLGDAGITPLPETGELELGYRLARAQWGRGLASEVARAWLDHAAALGLGRIIAFADRRHAVSIRVMEKLGMTFCRHDHLVGLDCVVYETAPPRVSCGHAPHFDSPAPDPAAPARLWR